MDYVIHLTKSCNLNCKYCYEIKGKGDILFEDIKLLIDNEIKSNSKRCILTFYGGEPLLKKDIIYSTINYINNKKPKTQFYYNMTTNGTLLDKEFMDYINQENFLNIAYSFDGIKETQNLNRITINGEPTFDIVYQNAKQLLENYDNVVAMVVVTKNNIKYLEENVEYLIRIGFKSINLLFDYLQDWQEEDLLIIKEQYRKVAQIYYDKILNEEEIEISVFDEKIKTYIDDTYNCNQICNLGMKNLYVSTDGNFYPCMQFVDQKEYVIGNCKDGIDIAAREKIIEKSGKENEICKECLINKRCKHTCACKNYLITKDINKLSPIVCELEKIIIEISDEMAEKLYKQKSKLFLQKYYNKNYGMFKTIIDKVSKK